MPPQLQTLSPDKKERLDLLLDKNAEGEINSDEQVELGALVAEAEQLMAANARNLADFARSQPSLLPVATPVTVWVTPHPAES
jgi:hypothetical protein